MMNDELAEKIYFLPGDMVTLRHDLPNKPVMLVTEIVTSKIKTYNSFRGIRCIWFTAGSCLSESIFSTKDLIKL